MQRSLVILLVMFTGALVLGVVTMSLLNGVGGANTSTGAMWILIGAGLLITIVAIAIVWMVNSASARRARRSFKSRANSRGFQYAERGDPILAKPVASAPRVRDGAAITHVFTGAIADRPVVAFQQTYQLNFGHGSIPITSSVVSVNGFAWPTVWIEPMSRWQRFWRRKSSRVDDGPVYENEAFRTSCRVTTEDEDFAIVLLSPEVQAFLAGDPTCAWYLTNGRLVVQCSGEMNAARLDALLDAIERFLELVPDELEYWHELRRT